MVDSRQVIQNISVNNLSNTVATELDDLLLSIDSETTSLTKMKVSGSNSVVIGGGSLANSLTGVKKGLPPLNDVNMDSFTGGSVFTPTTNGGNVTTNLGSATQLINIPTGHYIRVGVFLKTDKP